MTNPYTPEKVAELASAARKTAERIRNVIGPSDRYADMIDRLSDALEHRITWEDADTIALADYRLQLGNAVNRYAKAEAERDRLHKAITEALAFESVLPAIATEPRRILRAALDKEGNDDG